MPGRLLGVSRHGSSVTSSTATPSGAACFSVATMNGHIVWQWAKTNVSTTGRLLKSASEISRAVLVDQREVRGRFRLAWIGLRQRRLVQRTGDPHAHRPRGLHPPDHPDALDDRREREDGEQALPQPAARDLPQRGRKLRAPEDDDPEQETQRSEDEHHPAGGAGQPALHRAEAGDARRREPGRGRGRQRHEGERPPHQAWTSATARGRGPAARRPGWANPPSTGRRGSSSSRSSTR